MITKSTFNFIVTPEGGQTINNVTKSGLVLNTMMGDSDGRFLNRIGDVVYNPEFNPISAVKGDKVLLQHNTFRKSLDYSGKLLHGNLIGEGEYFIRPDLIFAYKKDGEWYSTNNVVYIDPQVYKKKGILESRETIRPDKGTIAFKQDPLFQNDELSVGDFVSYRIGKHVTTLIDGKTYHRVRTKDILLKHGGN